MAIYLEDMLSGVKYNGLNTNKNVDFSGATTVALPAGTTIAGVTAAGATTITSSGANALAVGPAGASNPVWNVDASTGSQAAGLNLLGATAAGNVALSVISSGGAANLLIDAKSTGTIGIGTVSTGLITLGANTAHTGTVTITSSNASALTVGRLGATTPVLKIDASTGTVVTGLQIKGAATAGSTALLAIGETNTPLLVDAAGSGVLKLNNAATNSGLVTIGNSTSLAGALVNGPLNYRASVLASSGNTSPTAAQSGSWFLFDSASGVVFTLPAPVVGMQYSFLVSVTATSNTHKVITNAGSVFIAGAITGCVNNTAVKSWVGDGATHVSISQAAASTNAAGGIIGSWVTLTCVTSTLWVASGLTIAGGTPVTPFATS